MKELFSEHRQTYQKIKYTGSIILLAGAGAFGVTKSIGLIIAAVFFMVLFYTFDELISREILHPSKNTFVIYRFSELSVYCIFDYLFPTNNFIIVFWTLMILLSGLEYIVRASEYDRATIFLRKILFLAPVVIKVLVSFTKYAESDWFVYAFLQVIVSIALFSIADAFTYQSELFDIKKRQLTIEKSNIESNNEKLLDYQEKVKTINEQINYQKIDLARTLRELEQVNVEIESQSEILKYMASTFDVLKCMNVVTDSIMEVKKPKLCALYIDENVYQNKYSSCTIKTNYSSMNRRLKKEIDTIFKDCAMINDSKRIIKGDLLKRFKFIGEANINSIGLFLLKDKKKPYCLMMIGSDVEDHFDHSTKYYENVLIEFGAALKSTKLYLKMEDMARKDGLTGIFNRVYNTELFKKVSKEAISKNEPLTVALFDIDKFKNVNDTYGHLAGDEVIKMVARVTEKYAEKYEGFACRFGGEEFLLTLPGYDDKQALEILETMHEEIKSTTVESEGNSISINVCIGVSSYPSICSDPSLLVSRADNAMYYGKKNGRGRLVLDSPNIIND
ncbi:MAG: diguanylate cyclase [Lachnospiraceae bacterium]|nr:diguanylate cyclase [Lachnospiraceae bacterium]MBQ8318464.1 diguanylate cyclase [Lachnospiraceae bacterium]